MNPWIPGVVAIGAVGTIACGIFHPRCGLFKRLVCRGSSENPPRVALTFDDGPHPEATPAVLNILRDRKVPAAFFMIGCNAEAHPDIVLRAHREGHILGNHTYHHFRMAAFRGYKYWCGELARANRAIEVITGRRPALYRPPMGIKSPRMMFAARHHRMEVVTWTRRGLDGLPTTPDAILQRIVPRCEAGDVIVLHDGAEPGVARDPMATLEALPTLIDALRRRGFEFERLDRLTGVEAYFTGPRDVGRP